MNTKPKGAAKLPNPTIGCGDIYLAPLYNMNRTLGEVFGKDMHSVCGYPCIEHQRVLFLPPSNLAKPEVLTKVHKRGWKAALQEYLPEDDLELPIYGLWRDGPKPGGLALWLLKKEQAEGISTVSGGIEEYEVKLAEKEG